ncbi:AraC family transcriptional regulator [Qipengyuania aquimaris]|uniref:helix-turn-helix domain-containing protein n=1 Tax=Qipengyuania aquimaris TaxID=255984 RepID=UPI001C9493F2|nr:AraC family transcriptional regulator [Qipengyuania aquimaris]MBY6127223.1 AraC family transcriptional regulator [Qipengyuania aquimaris]
MAPWIQSLAVADIVSPDGEQKCQLFSANPAIRVLLSGNWRFETVDGIQEFDATKASRTLYFGPQTEAMNVSVEGPIRFLLVQFHPGAPPLDQSKTHEQTLNTIECFDEGLPPEIRNADYKSGTRREAWLDRFEGLTRTVLFQRVNEKPSEVVLAFYRRILTNPDFDMEEFARAFGISRRTLERQVKKGFGLSPKQAIRRARALDMAAALLGVAMPEDEAEFRLRYFDQPHMTREIQAYFGTSPGVLSKEAAILLRIDLEIRQMRRAEAMHELGIKDVPWRDPKADP